MTRLDKIRWAIAIGLVVIALGLGWFMVDTYQMTIESRPAIECGD